MVQMVVRAAFKGERWEGGGGGGGSLASFSHPLTFLSFTLYY